ncbi:MAG: glycosyltransferase family 2 protein [Methanobrevibacter sp.]|jgi:glycosyltransferase involved in cell wall biosynthesis|nr:glycosyltransferase family 2 protein [Candidatus Methanoflexus mossambicus]
MISVIINTLNEEKNIRNCLETVKWADEIVIVDMYSDDKTVEIAKNYTDKIFFHERIGYADPARQFALEKSTGDWVLMLDADEVVPIDLKNELIKIVESDKCDVAYILRRNYILGLELNGIRLFGKDLQPRFFKRDSMSFSEEIHKFYNVSKESSICKIKDKNKGIIHFASSNIDPDNNQDTKPYTTIEAQNILDGVKKYSYFWFIITISYWVVIMFKELILNIFKKDRYQNLLLATTSIHSTVEVIAKLDLYKKYGKFNPSEDIINEYQKMANEIIDEY